MFTRFKVLVSAGFGVLAGTGCASSTTADAPDASGINGSTDGATSDGATGDGATNADAAASDAGFADSGIDSSAQTGEDAGEADAARNVVPDAQAAPVVYAPDAAAAVYLAGVTVATLAGGSAAGEADGTGAGASFTNPTGIAIDGIGGVVVTDYDTGRIRMVSGAGVTTTIGQSPSPTNPFTVLVAANSYFISTDSDESSMDVPDGGAIRSLPLVPSNDDGGIPTASLVTAGFESPRTLITLPSGDIVVIDFLGQVVELFSPDAGTVSPIAGQMGSSGYANGTGVAAQFGYPVGGVLLPDGETLLVADSKNNLLRAVTLDGEVTTYAGGAGGVTAGWLDGPLAAATFSSPRSLAIDSAGNIYVSDCGNHAIRRIDANGMVTTIAGNGVQGWSDGTGASAAFFGGEGLAVSLDGTTVYLADGNFGTGASYNRIRIISIPGASDDAG